jgi:hypothetical protein
MPRQHRRMSSLEVIGLLASALALIASFLPWQVLSTPVANVLTGFGVRAWSGAWTSGPLAWLPVVLLILVGLLLLGLRSGLRLPGAAPVWLLLAVASVVLIVIGWVTIPQPSPEEAAKLGLNPADVSATAGWGLYLGLVAAAISVLAALGRLRSVWQQPHRT